jgi:hypothetical protein
MSGALRRNGECETSAATGLAADAHISATEEMGFMATKRQTTFAKMDRERAVRERRARKQEKKDAARKAKLEGPAEAAEDAGVAEEGAAEEGVAEAPE